MALSNSNSNSSRSPKANGLSNIFGLGGNRDNSTHNPVIAINDHNLTTVHNEGCIPRNDDDSFSDSDSHGQDDHESNDGTSRYLFSTQNQPMGRILLGLLNKNTCSAGKGNIKSMDLNIDDLAQDFCEVMRLNQDSTQCSVMQATAGIETRLLNKELNAHTVNTSTEPPT